MPRFPDRDSFPTAKELVNRYLQQDGLTYRDLRIALFWLGFGLLEPPTPERPTLSLVPLCKDLDLYADTAAELGYDVSASSVHEGPALPAGDAAAACRADLITRQGERGPSSSSSGSHSSSSSSGPHATAASSASLRPLAERRQACDARQQDCDKRAWQSGDGPWLADEDEEWRSGEENQAWVVREADAGDIEAEASRVLAYKVKLLHAGGWSSSSGSDGDRTPPTPPASSSAAAAAAAEALQPAGGLNADHVGQFTVSFVSDLELHEELEETSCLCTFCLDEMEIGEELCRLPCMHTFHRRCVYAWLQRDRRCMLCRLDVTRPCG